MENIYMESSSRTPLINFDFDEGKLELRGRSIPENSKKMFEPLFSWMDKYAENPKPVTKVTLALEYFNTSSSKCLLDFLKRLDDMHTSGNTKVEAKWIYEFDDPQMLEAGENYQQMISMQMKMESVERFYRN